MDEKALKVFDSLIAGGKMKTSTMLERSSGEVPGCGFYVKKEEVRVIFDV